MNAKIIKRLRVDARKDTQLAYRHEVYTPRKGLSSNVARSAIEQATPSSGGIFERCYTSAMKAVVIERFGGPEVLEVKEVAAATATGQQQLVACKPEG